MCYVTFLPWDTESIHAQLPWVFPPELHRPHFEPNHRGNGNRVSISASQNTPRGWVMWKVMAAQSDAFVFAATKAVQWLWWPINTAKASLVHPSSEIRSHLSEPFGRHHGVVAAIQGTLLWIWYPTYLWIKREAPSTFNTVWFIDNWQCAFRVSKSI